MHRSQSSPPSTYVVWMSLEVLTEPFEDGCSVFFPVQSYLGAQ